MLADLPCEQDGHFWVIISPPQFKNDESAIYCYCTDCAERKWVKLSTEKFEEIYKKSYNGTLSEKKLYIGRITKK